MRPVYTPFRGFLESERISPMFFPPEELYPRRRPFALVNLPYIHMDPTHEDQQQLSPKKTELEEEKPKEEKVLEEVRKEKVLSDQDYLNIALVLSKIIELFREIERYKEELLISVKREPRKLVAFFCQQKNFLSELDFKKNLDFLGAKYTNVDIKRLMKRYTPKEFPEQMKAVDVAIMVLPNSIIANSDLYLEIEKDNFHGESVIINSYTMTIFKSLFDLLISSEKTINFFESNLKLRGVDSVNFHKALNLQQNGIIEKLELEYYLHEFKFPFQDSDLNFLFLVFDRDRSGKISLSDISNEFNEEINDKN